MRVLLSIVVLIAGLSAATASERVPVVPEKPFPASRLLEFYCGNTFITFVHRGRDNRAIYKTLRKSAIFGLATHRASGQILMSVQDPTRTAIALAILPAQYASIVKCLN
ncbi:MAG: hypothetical protein OYG32_01530 [Rhodospirillaceae bacterium]|nr:hypothetical protein [Rhodospirillaceae bacterium]MDE0253451.1 hypothetical protein [Rhodospirillaceae bacterium]MDE0617532.1 hypothetical protein [Rhodospirillaceae bacterium]